MNHVNRGKQFESCVREGLQKIQNTTVTRLIDPQNGYSGVRNPCDFIVYHYPAQYFIECKSCYGNTLSFSNITDFQWQRLVEVSACVGVSAGVLIWFMDHDKTIWVPIQYLEAIKKYGAKSIHVAKIDYNVCLEIPGEKKRILFDYDFSPLLCGRI